ncbi:MAG: hypothetical protein ACRCV0_01915 [Brevinema sp.]
MRYLSMFGNDGFRTFRGMLNGKLLYAPEKLPKIDPEILSEHDYARRIQEVLAPFADNHPKIKDIASLISSDLGSLTEIHAKYAVWRPKNHLSFLGQHLIAGTLAAFDPEAFQQTLYYIADEYDTGIAFAEAFSLEQKEIFIPKYLIGSVPIPKIDNKTTISQIDQDQKEFLRSAQQFLDQTPMRFDGLNILRIIGHIATMVNALYLTEKTHFRFFNDPVSLALPADDMEFLLAALYLVQSDLPIRHIYAVSSDHRMIHNFLEKGEFVFNGTMPTASFMLTLYRFLFEASRGSVEKLLRWKQDFISQGSFKIDSSTLQRIQKIFKPVFTSKSVCTSMTDKFINATNLAPTKLSLSMYAISQDTREQILAFDLQNPALLLDNHTQFPIKNKLPYA